MQLFGIDVSEHQKTVNWSQVKDAGVKFAMIRAGYGRNNVDEYFHQNAKNALAAGIPIGIYWFSYAYNVQMAKNEANYAIALAKQYDVTWPICYDLEYDTIRYASQNGVTITKSLATQMAKAFCDTVKAAGYTPMNYSNLDYYNNYFEMSQLPYDLWYAQYASKPSIDGMEIWQYSSSGSVPGVSGNCDVNYAYKDYGAKAEPVKKVTQPDSEPVNDNHIHYRAHVQHLGTLPVVRDGQIAGTTGAGYNMEGLYVDLRILRQKYPKAKLAAKVHIQGIGWKKYDNVEHDTLLGTTGQNKRIEAIELEITGLPDGMNVYYRPHLEDTGWADWISGGFSAGTVGIKKAIEAIQIKVE